MIFIEVIGEIFHRILVDQCGKIIQSQWWWSTYEISGTFRWLFFLENVQRRFQTCALSFEKSSDIFWLYFGFCWFETSQKWWTKSINYIENRFIRFGEERTTRFFIVFNDFLILWKYLDPDLATFLSKRNLSNDQQVTEDFSFLLIRFDTIIVKFRLDVWWSGRFRVDVNDGSSIDFRFIRFSL